MLSTAAYLSDVQISYGVDTDIPQAMQGMDPWTVTLITEHGSESFPYFMGRGPVSYTHLTLPTTSRV